MLPMSTDSSEMVNVYPAKVCAVFLLQGGMKLYRDSSMTQLNALNIQAMYFSNINKASFTASAYVT